jgi:hypothetical protein
MNRSKVYSWLSLILSLVWAGCVPLLYTGGMLGLHSDPWTAAALLVVLLVFTVILSALMIVWPEKLEGDD